MIHDKHSLLLSKKALDAPDVIFFKLTEIVRPLLLPIVDFLDDLQEFFFAHFKVVWNLVFPVSECEVAKPLFVGVSEG